MVQESLNPYDISQRQFELAADRLGLEDSLREVLRSPRRQLVVSVPTLLDDGSVRTFTGFRVQHNTARGPSQGGVRYHPKLTLDDAKAHACWTTWKCALVDIPYGGAYGGVACELRKLSRPELERMTRRYAAEVSLLLGPESDVAAPDMYTDSRIMAWILDTYGTLRGAAASADGVAAGQPRALGGGLDHGQATARGALLCLREACAAIKKPLRNVTLAVQGFGNVGAAVACLAHDEGARLVAAGDSRGGVYSSRGLDPRQLIDYKRRSGTLVGFRGAEHITNDELLEVKCDALVPAALGGQITLRNAGHLRARVVAELAGGATTPGADRVLRDKGAIVVPDILCASGGVASCHLEKLNRSRGVAWDEAELSRELERQVKRTLHQVQDAARESKLDLRTAAHALAIGRVADAVRARGLFP